MKTCKTCGKELNDDMQFCPNCGTRVDVKDDAVQGETTTSSAYYGAQPNQNPNNYNTYNNDGGYNNYNGAPNQQYYGASNNYYPPAGVPGRPTGLQTAAKVFMILSIVSCVIVAVYFILFSFVLGAIADDDGFVTVIAGIYLAVVSALSLAWTIPMFVSYNRKTKRGEQVSTAFKVCTLLFVNLIAGILMLCDNN